MTTVSVDPARRARGLELRMVLAVRAGESATAQATAESVQAELEGSEVDGRSPTSLALRTLLAGAALYEPERARLAAAWLIERFEDRRLALPESAARGERVGQHFAIEPAALWDRYAKSLLSLDPSLEPRVENLRQRARCDFLRSFVGDLPLSAPAGEHGFRFVSGSAGAWVLVWREEPPEGRFRGVLLDPAVLPQSPPVRADPASP